MYYWSWKENIQCVCITGVGGKNTQICVKHTYLGVFSTNSSNTYTVGVFLPTPVIHTHGVFLPPTPVITGVGGKKTLNVYVLLVLLEKTHHPMCMYYWSWWKKTSNVYVLLELEGKHPMCMYYWSASWVIHTHGVFLPPTPVIHTHWVFSFQLQ
jgi:hypothetical protein